ncbi:MAG: sugar-phosphate isomerase, RpiB/LacA/LacB family [Acidimicrobiales bacterium]|nr:sugar-phosphate isomerase, RpiB/LacA/LacB family [Acidimicrobiales bacterium]
MAEHLLRHRLHEAGIDATVRSAGFVYDDRPAERRAIAALAEVGVALDAHRASLVTPELVTDADVVLAMEQAHVRDLALLAGADFGRIFTFPDLVSRAEQAGPLGSQTVASWLAKVAGDRVPRDLLMTRPDLEVRDPMGQSKRAFRACAAELDRLAARFVAAAWAPAEPGDQPALLDHPTLGST